MAETNDRCTQDLTLNKFFFKKKIIILIGIISIYWNYVYIPEYWPKQNYSITLISPIFLRLRTKNYIPVIY